MTSHSGAYSRFESPAPCSESGKKRFQRPADLALLLELLHDRGRAPAVLGGLYLVVKVLLVRVDVLVHERL
jgi:hypothetical protein